MFVGAWSIVKPIQLNPASVAPTCVPFMKSTSRVNDDGAKQSMMSRMYGVRDVLYSPGSGDDGGSTRFSSAHWDTSVMGGGVRPEFHA
jgi:hypothetical protein